MYCRTALESVADLSRQRLVSLTGSRKSNVGIKERSQLKMEFSARAYGRILKVARTIADRDARDQIAVGDTSEAVQYRSLGSQCVIGGRIMPMNTEERFERIERQMQLVGEHLLLAASHLAGLTSAQHATDVRVSQLVGAQTVTDGRVRQLVKMQHKTDGRVSRLAEATDDRLRQLAEATDDRLRQLAEAQTRLTENQQSTDDRLNILINVIERYFSNGGRN
ncbi:MAG: hypothetical protein ACR2L2_05425 [Acidobacteriota bacterium]